MAIRVAVGQFHDLSEERLRSAVQIGVSSLQMNNSTQRWQRQFRARRAGGEAGRAWFRRFLLDGQMPEMDSDSDWSHRGRSYAIGYMQGLTRMAEFLRAADK